MEILILFIPGSMSIRQNFLVAKHVVKIKVVYFVAVLFGRTVLRHRHLFSVSRMKVTRCLLHSCHPPFFLGKIVQHFETLNSSEQPSLSFWNRI